MRQLLPALLACAAVGCTSNANIAGSYTASITQGTDGCRVATSVAGATVSGVTIDVTQNGDSVQAVVGGADQAMLTTLIGSTTFTGNITGDSLQLTIIGEFTRTIESCSYHLDSVITATANGSSINGNLAYRAVTDDPTCTTTTDAGSAVSGAIGCDSEQMLVATKI